VLIVGAADVETLLPLVECIDAVEAAFRRLGLGSVEPPGVLGMHVPNGGFHVKVASLRSGRHWFAAKANGNFPGNPERHGLPSIQGVLFLADADDGTPLAVMDSMRITELRTAAATAVAARHLARADARVLTLVGCGAQAPSHLRALAAVRPLERVYLLDSDASRARTLADRMRNELGISVDATTDLGRAVAASDIVVTCTTARVPILDERAARPGLLIAGVGADSPHKHELAPSLLRAGKVVVDSLVQCSEIGDLHHAIEAGAMTREDVHAELAAVVAHRAPGRTSDDESFVFDSTGTAIQDVASAALVYERAVAAGRGLTVSLA
jgi:ornithine cyclodeaminase/alanine dehydrogenase-like protein (mu-crystallin family)